MTQIDKVHGLREKCAIQSKLQKKSDSKLNMMFLRIDNEDFLLGSTIKN